MIRKPANLIYGLEDKPTLYETVILALQHIFIITVSFVMPVILIQEIGGTEEQAAYILRMSMLAAAIGVWAQACRRGGIGSGYLCPQVCGPSFLVASIIAGKAGGLGAVFGGTFMAGILETFLARLVRRVRSLFPPEVIGTVVAMVGITLIPAAMRRFLCLDIEDASLRVKGLVIALLTLAVVSGINAWGRGKLRLYSILFGMIFGYGAAWMLGLFTEHHYQEVASAPLVAFPRPFKYGWSLPWAAVIPFCVACLCSTLKSVGDIITCQKINDDDWKRADMNNVCRGLMADAAGAVSAGVLGGMGQSTSSSNVALSIATGATSRSIAWVTGIMLFILALLPKVAAVFAIMPGPVMGATLVFCLSFMIVTGLQIITSRMLDGRKTVIVGISMILGMSVDMLPHAWDKVPALIKPVFSSSLGLSAVTAVILNFLFRIGMKKHRKIVLPVSDTSLDQIHDFMTTGGRSWGARPEIIQHAIRVLGELFEMVLFSNLASGDLTIEASFDEFNLDLCVSYPGKAPDRSASAPLREDVLRDEPALSALSAHIIRRSVDRLKVHESAGGCAIDFHFDH